MEHILGLPNWHRSPVWVRAVVPKQRGAGVLQLDFYHANYPESVRDKVYDLRVVHRAEGYLLALRVSEDTGAVQGTVILQSITTDWMTEHFPSLVIRSGIPLAGELDRVTGRTPDDLP